jgi:tetratricopeptide (TPR) repeat protein
MFAKSKLNQYICIHLCLHHNHIVMKKECCHRFLAKFYRLTPVLIITILMLCACGNGGTSCGERNDEQEKALCTLDDSVNVMSPNGMKMIAAGMGQAKDSISYYEFKVRLGIIYGLKKSDSCAIVTRDVLKFAMKQKQSCRVNELIAQCYSDLGNYFYIVKMNADSALHCDMLAYQYMMKSHLDAKICDISANIADIYTQSNDMANGAKWYRRGLFLADSLNLPKSVNTSIYLGLAQVYTYLRDYDSALHYYTMANQRISDLKPNMRIYLLNNFGNFYFFKGDYQKALTQFRRLRSQLKSEGLDNSLDTKICLLNMADVFQNLNMKDSARLYLQGLEPYFKTQKLEAAVYYVNTIKIALALKDNDVAAAKNILEAEGEQHVNHSDMTNIRDKYLLDYYVKTGNYKKAFENISNSTRRNDSIEKSKSHVRTAEIMMRFQQDTLALHKKINIEEKNREVKNAYDMLGISLSAIIIITLVAIIIGLNSRKRRVQMEYDMLKLHMTNIRNRISPHFIFNVLNHEINDKNNNTDSTQLSNLTLLIRSALNISDKTTVSLKEELAFVDEYIGMERPIIGDDFEYKYAVSPDINPEKIKLPSMFIQLLVENAIKHGLKTKEGKKLLTVDIAKDGAGYTSITVTDNGAGFDITRMDDNSTGTGLNVIRQTILIFNAHNAHKMRFSISNRNGSPETGCIAVLRIPDNIK